MTYHIIHIGLHTFEDVLYLIPYLYITYVILEYIEHHAQSRLRVFIRASHRFAPFFGAVAAPFSGCGLSAAAAHFYLTRIISLGTLIAVYLATSDEMLPLMIAAGISTRFICLILIFKVIFATGIGFVLNSFSFVQKKPIEIKSLCQQAHCGCHRENIWMAAFIHTFQLTVFIFVISFILNMGFEFLGTDFMIRLTAINPVGGILVASLFGLIPNCAVSIGFTQLYIENIIPIYVLMAGLLSNAGVGLLVFYKSAHSFKETLKIAFILWISGIIGGSLAFFALS